MPVSNSNLNDLTAKLSALHIESPVKYAKKRTLAHYLKKNTGKKRTTIKASRREKAITARRMKMFNNIKSKKTKKAAETRRHRREVAHTEALRLLENAATTGIGTRSRVRREKAVMKE